MNFNEHSNLKDKHAYLGASKYSWLNYSEDKLRESYFRAIAAQKGTELHAFASSCIKLRQKLPKSNKTLNAFVNDAIGFKMSSERILYYSDNCFGTADAINFKNGLLRIFDLKTGVIPAHMEQLLIYAALFCLEYKLRPSDIEIELRIYQNDDVVIYKPEADEIVPIMDKIKTFDRIINEIKKEDDI
jgi:hypothetical protein